MLAVSLRSITTRRGISHVFPTSSATRYVLNETLAAVVCTRQSKDLTGDAQSSVRSRESIDVTPGSHLGSFPVRAISDLLGVLSLTHTLLHTYTHTHVHIPSYTHTLLHTYTHTHIPITPPPTTQKHGNCNARSGF